MKMGTGGFADTRLEKERVISSCEVLLEEIVCNQRAVSDWAIYKAMPVKRDLITT